MMLIPLTDASTYRRTSVRRNDSLMRELLPGPYNIITLLVVVLLWMQCMTASAQLTYKHLAVQYDSPWTCGKLQLIPIRYKDTGKGKPNLFNGGLISFEDAMRQGKLSVKESSLPGGADVGLLTIKNNTHKNVLLHSGDMVTGGKQDRAFAETTIIGPHEQQHMPVFCIEKGRWTEKSRSFRYGGQADAALKKEIEVTRKQNRVWKEIERRYQQKGIEKKTWAYSDIYNDTTHLDTACRYKFRRKMMDSDSAYAGFVAITGRRIINCEIFGSSDLCITSFDAMLKSYLKTITIEDGAPSLGKDAIKTFLDKFLETETQQQEYLSKHGRIYKYQTQVIHLVAYDE